MMTIDLIHLPAAKLLDKFGAGGHKPGSGSAAALQGIISARLLQTVIGLTVDPNRGARYARHAARFRDIQAAMENRIVPSLERSFQKDSDQFDVVIRLRQQRDDEADPVLRKELSDRATLALVPATEIPIQIATDCLELAGFAVELFDHGFQSALGDSGVTLNAALSGVSGSLSIVELNVQRFDASDWTDRIRASRDDLLTKLDQLTAEARKRLASQIDQSERKTAFSRDLQDITVVMKGKRAMPEAAIEAIAIRLQRALWTNRDWLWKDRAPPSEFDILDPDKALSCFGLLVHHATTLGQHFSKGTMYEVAGQIDQPAKVVSISKQIQPETRSFTTAHELGHYLLHTQPLLHRDRPLNGVRVTEPRDSEEWQADKFASYFLMPRKLLIKTFMRLFLTENFRITEQTAFALNEPSVRDLRNQCKNIRGLARLLARATAYNGVHFHSLSDRFKVSVEAMAIRLEELELVSY